MEHKNKEQQKLYQNNVFQQKYTSPEKSFFKRIKLKKMLLYMFFILIYSFIAASSVVIGIFIGSLKEMETWSKEKIDAKMQPHRNSQVFFNDYGNSENGESLSAGDLNSTISSNPETNYQDIPNLLIRAILSKEDANFFKHSGFDEVAITKAFYNATKKYLENNILQTDTTKLTGGSTITQQIAKVVILNNQKKQDRNFQNKVKELFISFRIEQEFSKEEILLVYINHVPLGNNEFGQEVHGFKSASQNLFGKDWQDLNLAESTYLAGMISAPANRNPISCNRPEVASCITKGKESQLITLNHLLRNQEITPQMHEEAKDYELVFRKVDRKKQTIKHPFVINAVELEMTKILEEKGFCKNKVDPDKKNQISGCANLARNNGYKIHTYLNPEIQKIIHDALPTNLNTIVHHNKKDKEHIALTVVGPKGNIIGFGNSHEYYESNYNNALQSKRQTGSSNKIIAVYGPALEKGTINENSIINDREFSRGRGKGSYKNADGRYEGPMPLCTAIKRSKNGAAIDVIRNYLGVNDMKKMLKRLDIDLDKNDGEPVALGGYTYGVTTKQMAGAFVPITSPYGFRPPYVIKEIYDKKGNKIFDHQKDIIADKVFSPSTQKTLIKCMRLVVTEGTANRTVGSGLKQYNDIIGKTGTTNDHKDSYFVGADSDGITIAVHQGYTNNITLSDISKSQKAFVEVYKALESKKSMILENDKDN